MTESNAPTAAPSRSLLRTPAARHLALVAVFGFTSFFLTLAALPTWAVAGGASDGAAGIVTTVMLATTVAGQAAVPVLERHLGVARLLALGLLALALPSPFYLLSHQLWWLSVLSAVRGLGFAVLTVLGAVLTARVAPPERHGEAVGLYGASIALPNLVAVPLGTALTLSHHFAWVAMGAVAPVLGLAFLSGLGGDGSAPAVPAETGGRRRTARAVAGPSTVLVVVTLAGGGVITFLPIARPDGALAAVTLLVFGATGALSRWRAGHLVARVAPRTLLAVGLVCAAAGLAAVAVVLRTSGALPAVLLISGAAVFGIGYGVAQTVTQVVAFRRAGPAHLVTASAMWNASYDAGTAIGAYAVGAVAAAGPGLPWTFALCAVLVAAALPVALASR